MDNSIGGGKTITSNQAPESSVRKRFIERVDGAFDKHFIKFFIIYPFTVTGWIIGLSQIVDATVVAFVILVATIVYYAIFTIFLCARYLRAKKQIRRLSKSVSRIEDERNRLGISLAERFRSDESYYRHINWVETIVISQDGDTRIERDITMEAGPRGADLMFHNLYGNKPTSKPQQVTFQAHIIRPGGEKVQASYDLVWENDSKLSTFVVLDQTYEAGESIRVNAIWTWPKYSAALMNGEPESHKMTMSRPCENFNCTIDIMKVDWFETHRITSVPLKPPLATGICTASVVDHNDRYTISFAAQQKAAKETFGIRVDAIDI